MKKITRTRAMMLYAQGEIIYLLPCKYTFETSKPIILNYFRDKEFFKEFVEYELFNKFVSEFESSLSSETGYRVDYYIQKRA